MSFLLTPKELEDLTGYQRTHEKKLVLQENYIRFIVRGNGKLALTWDMVNEAGKTASNDNDNKPADDGFNLKAM